MHISSLSTRGCKGLLHQVACALEWAFRQISYPSTETRLVYLPLLVRTGSLLPSKGGTRWILDECAFCRLGRSSFSFRRLWVHNCWPDRLHWVFPSQTDMDFQKNFDCRNRHITLPSPFCHHIGMTWYVLQLSLTAEYIGYLLHLALCLESWVFHHPPWLECVQSAAIFHL